VDWVAVAQAAKAMDLLELQVQVVEVVALLEVYTVPVRVVVVS
jgi:hypothetical protein